MELKDTIEMMTSEDYKERLKAEYYQLKIRMDKLIYFLDKWDKGELSFIPDCPRAVFDDQLRGMSEYRMMLVYRLNREGIEYIY